MKGNKKKHTISETFLDRILKSGSIQIVDLYSNWIFELLSVKISIFDDPKPVRNLAVFF